MVTKSNYIRYNSEKEVPEASLSSDVNLPAKIFVEINPVQKIRLKVWVHDNKYKNVSLKLQSQGK